MKNQLFLCLFYIFFCPFCHNSPAQFCTNDNRFTEAEYFSDGQIDSLVELTYGQAKDWNDSLIDLTLNVYFPSLAHDNLSRRPFILLIHGGGFTGGIKDSWIYDCREFAKRGFVAATMEYRRGWSGQVPGSYGHAVYRAQQDAEAAMRAIVQHQHAIQIDTSWMFIGGASAGAMTALNAVYINQAEWEARMPGIEALLGSLSNSGNNYPDNYTIKGVYNAWGATEKSAIELSDMRPMISFHGVLDHVVPIGEWGNGIVGSAIIHDTLVTSGFCSELTVDSLGGHTIYGNNTNPGDRYRAERVSCFFKSVFCDDCTSEYFTDSIPADCSLPPTVPLSANSTEFDDHKLFELNEIPTLISTHNGFVIQTNSSVNFEGNIYSINGKLLNKIEGLTNSEVLIENNLSGLFIITYKINNQWFSGRIVQ